MMVSVLLLLLTVLLIFFGYSLTAADSAFTYIPHAELQELTEDSKRQHLSTIYKNYDAAMLSLRVWVAFLQTLSILSFFYCVQILLNSLVVSMLLTGIIMTAVNFIFFSYYPRRAGREKPLSYVKRYFSVIYWIWRTLGFLVGKFAAEKDEVNRPKMAGYFTEDELKEFVERAGQQEILEDDEAQIMQSIFEVGDTRIRQVMVPRTDMVAIDIDDSIDNAINLFRRSGYSRMPVLGKDFDDIKGFLYFKDLMNEVVQETYSSSEVSTLSLDEIIRPARFEPESKRVMDLLRDMQRESTHVAVVIDEYGGTAGLVTLEDLIEELVGDISDEYDQEKPEIKMEEDGTFKISSRLSIEELGELFGRELEDEDIDTVGGLMSKHLGKVPIIGSEIVVDGIHLRAIGTQGRRHQISTLLVWFDATELRVPTTGPVDDSSSE